MEHIDRAASRVSIAAVTGFVGGAIYGTFKGHPVGPTAAKVSASVAIVGTALFLPERLAYAAFESFIPDNQRRLTLTSHAFAGVVGGGINGYFYQKRPLRGMFYFVPLMLGIGFLELSWEAKRLQRRKELLETNAENGASDSQQ